MSILFITKTSRNIRVLVACATRNIAFKFKVQFMLIKELEINFVLIISSDFHEIIFIV